MRWLIFALGVALALGGAASIVSGVPYIRIEFGWTEVIAGTTALSAGIVTVGLGAVLSALRSLESRLVEIRSASADVAALTLRAPEPMSLPAGATDPASDRSAVASREPDDFLPPVVERDSPPVPASRPLMGRMRSKLSTMGTPGNDRAEPSAPMGPSRSTERASGVRPAASIAPGDRDQAFGGRQPEVDQPQLAPPRSHARPRVASLTRDEADDRVPSLIPSPRQSEAADTDGGPRTSDMEAPTVVGRYESGGASYVLFSDGTIEVETEAGTHRFASMEELKIYIDQQDGSAAS